MKSQLCPKCQKIFADDTPVQVYIPHHQSRESILGAVGNGCRLCSRIVKSREFAKLDPSIFFITTGNVRGTPYRSIPPMSSVKLEIWLHPSSDSEAYQHVSEADGDRISTQDDEVLIPQSGRDFEFEPYDGPGNIPFQCKHHGSLAGTGCANNMWSLARSWLDECCQGHKKCSAPQSPDFSPTRLVEIVDNATVRVIERKGNKTLQRYVAFSHCWGKAETLKLLKDNKPRLETGISISELPQSYKEAIDACIRLNFKFIWIDSLCIIQDSTDDWRAESATMMHVYGNALLTIAAAAAAESSESSLTHRDSLNIQPTTIMVPQEGPGEVPDVPYILAPGEPFNEIKNSPLRRRAWVLQESYISNRILFLADTQLWWECREALCCESWPTGIPKEVMDETAYHHDRKKGGGIQSAHSVWRNLVQEYTRCRLTNFSDKLIAMAGLASHLQPSIGADEYVAGFWRSQLPHALCWGELARPIEGFRPSQYRAPSWSWASLEGVEFHLDRSPDHSVTDTCQILNIHLVHAGKNPYGDLKGGYMLLRGRLFPVTAEGNFTSNFQFLKFPDHTPSPNRTMYARWDEAISGNPLISHLDTSGIDLLEDASLISAKRVTKSAEHWEGDLFYFPVFEFSTDREPETCGLILGRAKGEPVDRFQRLGWSRCAGERPRSYFRRGESREFFIV
ncbi:hypothetical protein LCI18_011269 [Fusarium solani-melongenae]|uniref:Uncharacterized protein n=1 Tax=Fusarium solani subsp. cucurbitae TaxID=2747967 RepID=A0ACD3ZGB5_FUSSC|nr:hypothetical protein LCI18_011269 [Fusarium solani-melongenae]